MMGKLFSSLISTLSVPRQCCPVREKAQWPLPQLNGDRRLGGEVPDPVRSEQSIALRYLARHVPTECN